MIISVGIYSYNEDGHTCDGPFGELTCYFLSTVTLVLCHNPQYFAYKNDAEAVRNMDIMKPKLRTT